MNDTRESHWLRDVAAHAGLDLQLQANPPIGALRRAWSVIAKASDLSEEALTHRIAHHFRLGVADLSTWDQHAVQLVPQAVARRHGILPLSVTEDTLVVATSDPTNREARREIVANSSRQPVFLMAGPGAIAGAIEVAYAPSRSSRSALQTLVSEAASDQFTIVTSHGPGVVSRFELEAPAVVKLAEIIVQQAARYRASEIHLEPGSEHGRVRFRIDGVLQQFVDLPLQAYVRVVGRLKNQAHRPAGQGPEQDPGFEIMSGDRELRGTLHASATPAGERLTIRIADPDEVPSLGGLGLVEAERLTVEELLDAKGGLILVTGPTRSGKSWLVYAMLRELDRRGLSVLSLENPVELRLPGITQIPYAAASGLSFAETLQGLLDQGPDVIHAGEIRDLATARIAVRSAITGRKVIATLHTTDAVSAVRRLLDMGLAAGRVAESLRGVVALRLVRALCMECAEPTTDASSLVSRERQLAESLEVLPGRHAVGCPACGGMGHRGQLPLAEVLRVTAPLSELIGDGASDQDVENAAASAGMRTLHQVAIERVARGETTLQEIERTLGLVPQRDVTAGATGPVLIVDDEAQDRVLVRAALQQMGFRVIEAEDGVRALEILGAGEDDFTMVILDLFMPELSGLDVLRKVRQSLSTQALPVIVLTGSENPRDEIALLEAGADDYLLKPVEVDRLQARIRAVLRRGGIRLAD